MKKLYGYLTAAFVAAAMFISCVSEKTSFAPDGGGQEGETGYLSFGGSLTVEERNEQIGSTPVAGKATRAANLDLDTYTVEIINAKGEPAVPAFAYGDRSAEPIELPTGTYTLRVYSGETPDAAWEGSEGTPTYGTEQAFVINKGQVTDLGEITCRLLTVKVSVAYKQSLYDLLGPDTEADLVLSDNANLTFLKDEKRAGYLRPLLGQANSLVLYLTTVYEGKQITRQPLKVTDNARPGEWRKITVELLNGENGSIIITATIENWVNGETVDVDVQRLAVLSEASIPDLNDPNAPRIEWSKSHAVLEGEVLLNDDKFDQNGYPVDDYNLTLTTVAPASHFTVALASENAAFLEYARSNGVSGTLDLFEVEGQARTTLRLWGFPVMNLTVSPRTFDMKDLMKVLFDYEGLHTFTLVVTDEANRRSTFELKVRVDKSGGADPRIVWSGHDFSQEYTVTDDLEVEIRFTATKGIESLIVEIDGELGAGLPDVGLVPRFDLVDPETYQDGLSASLEGLGFPVGDGVRGKTEILFPITRFLPLMGTFKGKTTFRMIVTDSEGQSDDKTLMLVVE